MCGSCDGDVPRTETQMRLALEWRRASSVDLILAQSLLAPFRAYASWAATTPMSAHLRCLPGSHLSLTALDSTEHHHGDARHHHGDARHDGFLSKSASAASFSQLRATAENLMDGEPDAHTSELAEDERLADALCGTPPERASASPSCWHLCTLATPTKQHPH
jgi:hypothetical protein